MLNRTRLIDPPESASRSSSGKDGAPGVLGALRAATAERHELLHEIMPLSVNSVALRDYLAHLAILRDWLVPLEAWLGSFGDGPQSPAHLPAHSPVLPARFDRLALIAADLSHPSVDPHDRAGMPAPTVARAWRGDASAARRWGICYVIEGSQLGGAVLYAKLKDRLAPHPLEYLSAGRDSLGARWQVFLRAMAAEVDTATLIDEACRGAADAFDRLIELARCPATAACVNAD
ncbi:biliverdin-producing heme oxygenase [Paraburkholderia aromaticivorans]|uniref:biliverdin-producing heme oxygenase n=1 Tax=Paraburkholderia aromaticivorans TaxID=2026199 RepID=UPI0012FDFB7D|nr:biliverdin-producing heme oxygenase [Paraburkholderia aromaticivorans]